MSIVSRTDLRSELAALLATGVLRLAAERAAVARKHMRTPEPRPPSSCAARQIPPGYDLLTPRDQSVYAGQTGRQADRELEPGDGAQGALGPAAAGGTDAAKGEGR